MRGFLSGVIWGTAVSAVGVGAVSLIAPLAPVPDVGQVAALSEAAVPADQSGVAAPSGDADLVEAAPSSLSETSVAPLGSVADTDPGSQPDVTETVSGVDAPAQPDAMQSVTPQSDSELALVQPDAPTGAPTDSVPDASTESAAPAIVQDEPAENPVELATSETDAPAMGSDIEPAPGDQASAPAIAPSDSGALPQVGTAPGSAPQTAPSPDAPETELAALAPQLEVGTDLAPQTPTAPAGVDAPTPAALPEIDTQTAAAPAPVVSPETSPADTDSATPAALPAIDTATVAPSVPVTALDPVQPTAPDVAEAPAAPLPENTQRVAALPQAGAETETTSPSVGTPVVPLTDRNAQAALAQDPAVQNGVSPLLAYAVDFENPDDKPLMSIVLIDDEDSIGAEALADFPYPLTFAINPFDQGAAAKMQRHREAGFEVVALVDLPAQSRAQDVEVNLSVGFNAVPEALAVLEGTGSGVQGNRALSDQLTAYLGSTGRGLITQGNGLNTAQKLALRDGVPAAVVFRDFDGAGQTPTVMRRFLDQAAFRAGQEGAVIMMGRVRPDTVSALLLWGLQDRASRVALAPVSAVLTQSVAR
ncbi:MAG: divergent polysaccharide deacetylase family protein [Sedimentitalea sp.]